MGNYRFRLSDMMPNSWFYKLRDMGRATTSRGQTIHHSAKNTITRTKEPKYSKQAYTPNRPSYYFPSREQSEKKLSNSPSHPKASDTHFPIDPPRISQKKPRKRPIKPLSSVSKSDSFDTSFSSASSYAVTSSATDIIIDMKAQSSPMAIGFEDELLVKDLPRILTKPVKKEGIKVRQSTPKVEVKKAKAAKSRRVASSKRLAESFVVVKRSRDPRREFRESMVEMITENDIRGSKDLEELLVCYLALNSAEYHDLIVKVFEEIWVDLTEINQL